MIIEFRLEEEDLNPAYLKTLYDTIEELNCKSTTYIEETYNKKTHRYEKTRVVKVCGSDTMVGYLQFRLERYSHVVKLLSEGTDIGESC